MMENIQALLARRRHALKDALTGLNAPQDLSRLVLSQLDLQALYRSVHDEDALLNQLPSSLRHKVYVAAHAHLISHIPIFKYISNASYRYYLLRKLEPILFTEYELICSEEEPLDGVLFLVTGSAAIVRIDMGKHHEEVLDYLFPLNFIGQESLLNLTKTPLAVRAEEDCCFFRLKFSTIEYLLLNRPELCSALQRALTLATEDLQERLRIRRFRQQRFEFLKEVNGLYKGGKLGSSHPSSKAQCVYYRRNRYVSQFTDDCESSIGTSKQKKFPTLLDKDDNCDFESPVDTAISSRSRRHSVDMFVRPGTRKTNQRGRSASL